MGTDRRRVALIGAGHRAQLYLDALSGDHAGDGDLVALCDPNRTRMTHHLDRYASRRPDAPHVTTWASDDARDMLAAVQPDVVVIASPDATHAQHITHALTAGADVVVEKPMTTDLEGCRQVVEATAASDASLTVTFNYRYAHRNSRVRELLAEGAVGTVTSVHFEWLLDTIHGADYFRRWHRDRSVSGGLLVHKATHHFDLVNWWLQQGPATVTARGALRFYGDENARQRGLGDRPERSLHHTDDPFALDIAADAHLRALYLEAEHEDGYLRDRDVFSPGITIEDNLAVLATYDQGALLTYSLNAHAPWEGFRVAFNGTEGRLELDVVERGSVAASGASDVVGRDPERTRVDPSVGVDGDRARDDVRPAGDRLVLQRHWRPAERIAIPEGRGGHGGGDALLLDDIFRGTAPDPLGRRAGWRDGIESVLVGIAANRSIAAGGTPVVVDDLRTQLRSTADPDHASRSSHQQGTRA